MWKAIHYTCGLVKWPFSPKNTFPKVQIQLQHTQSISVRLFMCKLDIYLKVLFSSCSMFFPPLALTAGYNRGFSSNSGAGGGGYRGDGFGGGYAASGNFL